MESSAGMVAAAAAHAREMQMLVVEVFGLFWIAAELLVLFFMMEARRHVSRDPIPDRPVWDTRSSVRACAFAAFLACAALLIAIRMLCGAPLDDALLSGSLDIRRAALLDALAVRRHLALWAVFVTLWVLLEIAIVQQGWKAFRLLRQRLCAAYPKVLTLGGGGALPLRGLVFVLGGALLFLVSSRAWATGPQSHGATSEAWRESLRMSEEWLAPWRNALYLYLRLAGLVWIAVEWAAAIILWRAYSLLARVGGAGGGTP